MKNYTITVNGNVYDVTVEEGTGSAAAPAAKAAPKAAPKAAKKAAPAGAQGAVKVTAPMQGKILKTPVAAGSAVKKGDVLVVLEAMKMETTVISKVNGIVDKIYVKDGEEVNEDTLLASFIIDTDEQPEEVHPELPKMDLASLEEDEFKTVEVAEKENK